MGFVRDIAGVAGSEIAVLLAVGAAVLMLTGHGMSLDAFQFASGNF